MARPDPGARGPALRPFVDRPVGNDDDVARSARLAAVHWGLGEVELLRTGMNAVYAAGPVVVRVGRPTAPAEASLVLADRLVEAGVSVPRPARRDVVQSGDLVVTAWERVAEVPDPIDWRAVGAMVARVHRAGEGLVPPGYPCPSPASFPWWDFDRLLGDASADMDQPAVEGVSGVIERHRGWSDLGVESSVVCHGDVHPGNVLQTAAGPVLLDWDLLCRAPRGWDHGPMMTLAERWGGVPGEYEAFAEGYGWSARGDEFSQAVAELRLVAATLMRVVAGRHDPTARIEAQRRLAHWRGDPDAPTWCAS